VPPDIESRDVHADAEDVLAGDDTIHEEARIEVCGLLFLWSTRVEAAVLIRHIGRLAANRTHMQRSAWSCP
jgi:hypothetical protein